MENNLFENQYTLTRDDLKEIYTKIVWTSGVIKLSLFLDLVAFILLGFFAIMEKKIDFILMAVVVFLFIYCILYCYMRINQSVNITIHNYNKENPGCNFTNLIYIAEDIVAVNVYKAEQTHYGYNTVITIQETNNFIIAQTQSKQIIIWKVDSFKSGNREDFLKTMKDKCNNAKFSIK